nr:hypothetical protein [uncultured Flavobacterium sp.]
MERELPTINIEGTEFIVDVIKLELREKSDLKNTIPFEDMRDVGDGYTFEYSLKNKNIPGLFDRESTTVRIPEFVMLDPIGMADKYNHSVDGIKGKSDFDLMVNQETYDMRVNKGILPTVDIAGHTFYVDIRMDKLRPKDDFLSNGIVFSDIETYYDLEKRTYTIPYNPKTREFQEPDYLNIKELPKDLIAVRFPSERLLDRIGWNRKYGFEIRHGLVRNGLKLQFAAKKVPWKNTFLVDLIKSNLKAEKKQEKASGKQQLIQPKQNKGRRI